MIIHHIILIQLICKSIDVETITENNISISFSYSQYGTYNSTMPFMTVPSNLVSQQQEPTQTTTTTVEPSPNTLVDKGTLTYMVSDRKKHKPANKTVVIHTSRNPTPPAPKIIIEKPHRSRLPRKLQSTTVLKERTTQTPHTTTTTYVQT